MMSWRDLIRVELGAEIDGPLPTSGRGHGVFAYHATGYPLVRGFSRQPLLDACRQLKSLYGLPRGAVVGLFRKGREVADLACPLDVGAATTVRELNTTFRKFEPFAIALRAA